MKQKELEGIARDRKDGEGFSAFYAPLSSLTGLGIRNGWLFNWSPKVLKAVKIFLTIYLVLVVGVFTFLFISFPDYFNFERMGSSILWFGLSVVFIGGYYFFQKKRIEAEQNRKDSE
ncbi:MAG: hypothetical protein LBR25_10375 [Erysipelotrichaceae bacterium]|jgi:hypothetical protein|nr:hypothetical protein [Erysipelotrichaceae bacterium]